MLKAAEVAAPSFGVSKSAVRRRLKLYERVTDNPQFSMNFVSGIQSRIFSLKSERVTGRKRSMEWVASSTRDFFIQRDETSMPRDVIAEQWFPILKHWEANDKQLPQTDSDLERVIKGNNGSEKVLDVNLPQSSGVFTAPFSQSTNKK